VFAGTLHQLSARSQGPFIKVNCGAIPENLMDSELFGHEQGAFTGAVAQKKGRFERADSGTIFLDEVGELSPDAQVRLLRVLQEKEIERVGGTEPLKVDIRVIAATHRDLPDMIRQGAFREDLFFRLNVFPITIPPLRERPGDIPALLYYFVQKTSHDMGRSGVPRLNAEAVERLSAYAWPGNVRELQNVVERELILNPHGPLMFEEIRPPSSTEPQPPMDLSGSIHVPEDILPLDTVMADYIEHVLGVTNGRIEGQGSAADLLDINPSTLRKRPKTRHSFRQSGSIIIIKVTKSQKKFDYQVFQPYRVKC
jgi:transcriptional regulator with PAS, ATPase and Fis domain